MMKGSIYFVKKPSRLNDLLRPHRIEDEVPYEIVKTILLPQIDYENFATDLTVDLSPDKRPFPFSYRLQ